MKKRSDGTGSVLPGHEKLLQGLRPEGRVAGERRRQQRHLHNLYEITAIGPEIIVKLNDNPTAHWRDSQFASGPIALQWGRGIVKFRKVEIKPL